MTFSEIASKKVLGVPVLYLAGAAVIILAIVAWRMKPANEDNPVTDNPFDDGEDATLDENGIADGTSPYAGFRTNGTVIVTPSPEPEAVEPDRPDTNEEWVKEGAEWLVADKNVPGPAAYTALDKYVKGQSRSYTEAQWVEWVIKEKGFPPDTFEETPQPTLPTPTAPKPAPTYRGYGWYRADGKISLAQIAAKYKVSATMVYGWNPGLPRVPKSGTYVKVRANANPTSGYKGK